jgi:hypothetical protein
MSQYVAVFPLRFKRPETPAQTSPGAWVGKQGRGPENAPTAARCGLAGASGGGGGGAGVAPHDKTLACFDERLDWVTRRYEQMVAAGRGLHR